MKKYLFLFLALAVSCTQVPQENRIAITAHRGFWDSAVARGAQNSIASLGAAQAIGVWGSEFDLHLTADDTVLVNHDDSREGLLIADTPFSTFAAMSLENGERPATLDEYLTQGTLSDVVMVAELKPLASPEREDLLIEKTLSSLKAHGLYDPEKTLFISFSLYTCERLAALCPGFTVQYLEGDKTPEELNELGINGLDYGFWVFDEHPDYVERAHALGMSVNVWTVDEREDLERMIALGVDCITTNAPLLARELLGERELTVR